MGNNAKIILALAVTRVATGMNIKAMTMNDKQRQGVKPIEVVALQWYRRCWWRAWRAGRAYGTSSLPASMATSTLEQERVVKAVDFSNATSVFRG